MSMRTIAACATAAPRLRIDTHFGEDGRATSQGETPQHLEPVRNVYITLMAGFTTVQSIPMKREMFKNAMTVTGLKQLMGPDAGAHGRSAEEIIYRAGQPAQPALVDTPSLNARSGQVLPSAHEKGLVPLG